MGLEGTARTSYTYELTNDQQEILLGIMLNGNYRRREVPYALWSIEGDHFNATLYAKERHGRRKLCVQGSKAEDFVLFVLEPNVLGAASLGYENVLNPAMLVINLLSLRISSIVLMLIAAVFGAIMYAAHKKGGTNA